MYQFYYSPGACSMSVHVFLQELGAPFTAHKIETSKGEQKTPEYLKINPFGWVPTLVTANGTTLTEGAAILTYLADAHPSEWFPAPGATAERAQALNWLAFCNATLHAAYSKYFMLRKADMAESPLMATVQANIAAQWQQVENRLAQSAFLAGEKPTVADIMLTVMANWNMNNMQPVAFGPNTQRVINAISNRPTFRQTTQAENITYKAAA